MSDVKKENNDWPIQVVCLEIFLKPHPTWHMAYFGVGPPGSSLESNPNLRSKFP